MRIEFLNSVDSEALETLCEKKLSKLEKYFKGGEPKIQIGFTIDNRDHIVTLFTKYNSFELKAKGKSADMYKSLDIAIENLKDQMLRNKFDKKSKRTEKIYEL